MSVCDWLSVCYIDCVWLKLGFVEEAVLETEDSINLIDLVSVYCLVLFVELGLINLLETVYTFLHFQLECQYLFKSEII